MSIDFKKIRAINGSQKDGFEEFVCHIARNNDKVPAGSKYERYRGAGGDGGVECIWKLPDGKELAWQAKYFFSMSTPFRNVILFSPIEMSYLLVN